MKHNIALLTTVLLGTCLAQAGFADCSTKSDGTTEAYCYDFDVDYKKTYYAGVASRAIAINGEMPGPTIYMKEGEPVTINVHNKGIREGITIHWHGLEVPWVMDGVPDVTQKAIRKSKTFKYHYTPKQAGTYWYHSHVGFQDGEGLNGAIIVEPKTQTITSDKDFPIVLSSWSNTPLAKVYSDSQSTGKPINDDSYDAFLMNGKSTSHPWKELVNVGDTVRLRFIGASVSTKYNVSIPGTKMQMVQVDGQDVSPYNVKAFSISPGETYDVLVNIEEDQPYIIYAQSSQSSEYYVYGALVTDLSQAVDYSVISTLSLDDASKAKKGAEFKLVEEALNYAKQIVKIEKIASKPAGKKKTASKTTQKQKSAAERATNKKATSKVKDKVLSKDNRKKLRYAKKELKSLYQKLFALQSSPSKYDRLKATSRTNNPNAKPDQLIIMDVRSLDLGLYLISKVPSMEEEGSYTIGVDELSSLPFTTGQRTRLIMYNANATSEAYHPMHIHGHWFLMHNGQNSAYYPKLHTIEVGPNDIAISDILSGRALGTWYFHCHNLYHMKEGMLTTATYSTATYKDIKEKQIKGNVKNRLSDADLGKKKAVKNKKQGNAG